MARSFNDHRTLQTVAHVDKNVILVWSGVVIIKTPDHTRITFLSTRVTVCNVLCS
jgi:hypothetical protein